MIFSENLEYFICGSNQEISTWKLFSQKVWIILNIFHIYDVFIRWILFEIEPFEIANETHFFRWKSPKMMTVRVTGIYSSQRNFVTKSNYLIYLTRTNMIFYISLLKACRIKGYVHLSQKGGATTVKFGHKMRLEIVKGA